MENLLSLTMWAGNHTLECLCKKEPKEKDRISNVARVKKEDIKRKYKDRAETLRLEKRAFGCLMKKREKLSFRHNLRFSETSLLLHAALGYLIKPS